MNAEEKAQELDKAIKELSELFNEKIPETIKVMEDELKAIIQDIQNQASWKSLHRQLHSLAGSAGTFGYTEFGERARTLEIRINTILKSDFNLVTNSKDTSVKQAFIQDQQEFIAWARQSFVKNGG